MLFKLEFYPANFHSLHSPVNRSWLIISSAWRYTGGVLTVSCRNVRQVSCLVAGLKVSRIRWLPWSSFGTLPAERCTLYYCFRIRSISEAIFSFPDNLSRNIKYSLTTVNLPLILEWHSDVSQYSFILEWIHVLLYSSVSWIWNIHCTLYHMEN